MKNFAALLCFFTVLPVFAQLTPAGSLNLQQQFISIPNQFKPALPDSLSVNLADGYKARIFYAGGLSKPRFLSFDEHGVLHVADQAAGKIYAMPDKNNNGIADTLITAAQGFTTSHDVKFYNGNMYVTETSRIWKLTDANNDGVYEQREIFIDNLAQGGNHITRTVLFDSINQKVYVSVGSACNACRETQRAVIEQYDIDGSNKRIFADGVRNAVGLTLHPVTNKLWANNNGSDNLGNAIPPEWIDIVRDNGYYGYPLAYGNKTWVNFNAHQDYQALLPITAADTINVNKMVLPAAQIEAHSAPMALSFLNNSFPLNIQNGLINALRGSWNAPGDHRGYKLIYVDFTDATDTTANFVADFCTGFITDTVSRKFWARPVGVAVNNKGEIFMSSDETNKFIMQIYKDPSVGVKPILKHEAPVLQPNPANGLVKLMLKLHENAMVSIVDANGLNHPIEITRSENYTEINTSGLDAGTYFIVITDAQKTVYKKLVVIK